MASPADLVGYRAATLQVGSLSLQTSELALQRAANPFVRQFAGFERDEQLTIAQVLMDMPSPPPAPLDPTSQSILQSLAATYGPQFDATYVADQMQAHQQLLNIQQTFLQNQRSIGTDAVHIAMLARTVIMMHIAMLQDIQQRLGLYAGSR